MQRMSAIATKTKSYVDLLQGTNTKILDTRKTTPGFRACEKWAVTIGGGENHRFALYDMIMLKDNHIDFAYFYPFVDCQQQRLFLMQLNQLQRQPLIRSIILVFVLLQQSKLIDQLLLRMHVL